MSLRAYRTDLDAAAEHLRSLWPDETSLRAAARMIAKSIRHAHAQAPECWELTLFRKFLRLNVGQIAVLELYPDQLSIYAIAGTAFPPSLCRQIPFRGYSAVNVPTVRLGVALRKIASIVPELTKRHMVLVETAARAKRISPFQRAHSPGAVGALGRLADGQLPNPHYIKPSESISHEGMIDGCLFGSAEQNAEVEQAAVQIVTARLQADGWVVRSVELERCGYDLHCQRGRTELHVEVKGTRGAATHFVMTAGEVRQADTDPNFTLMLVSDVLGATPKVEEWPGRSFESTFQLEPLQYIARRSASD